MQEILKKYSDIEHCPVRNVISHFSTKWGLLILAMLGEARCMRFNEILHALPDISPKVLSSTLKTLEMDGLIKRKLYPSVPPKVEYSITDKADSLMPILGALIKWGIEQLNNNHLISESRNERSLRALATMPQKERPRLSAMNSFKFITEA